MRPQRRNVTASRAAVHLGVSVKTLRIYERHGLLAPGRTAAGWRTYTPDDLERARRIVSLRVLGLGLAEIGVILDGDPRAMDAGLALHAGKLQHQAEHIAATLQEIRNRRHEAFRDRPLASTAATGSAIATVVGFELPWPWGGERFELREVGPLNFITGPLGSGKTRFAMQLAEALPNAVFLGLDRLADDTLPRRLAENRDLAERVERALAGLAEAGAERSNALVALVTGLETCGAAYLVVDMVEQDLSEVAQRAVISYLRTRHGRRPNLFLMTRSSAILDLNVIGPDESVIFCPANHGPPFRASARIWI